MKHEMQNRMFGCFGRENKPRQGANKRKRIAPEFLFGAIAIAPYLAAVIA